MNMDFGANKTPVEVTHRLLKLNVSINGYNVKYGTSLRFWENKGWINSIDPYGWLQLYFRYWLGKVSLHDERQIARWKGIVGRFKSKLIKKIKYSNDRFDDYSISPKIRQILLDWGHELVESDCFFCLYKNEVFWFNRQELLQKAKSRYHNCGGKEKAAEYYFKDWGFKRKSKK